MQDLFELTPELLLEQSQEMFGLCSAYENLFSNISSDLNGINSSWSDLLSNNFSAKIGSAQKAFSGALSMLHNSANSARVVAETAQEMDVAWATRIGGSGFSHFNVQTLLSSLSESIAAGAPAGYDHKQLLDALKVIKESYKEDMPPSIQAWIKWAGKEVDKAVFDKNLGKIDDVAKVLEKLSEGDIGGAVKSGGKTILKEVFKDAVKGTGGSPLNIFGTKYDPSVKYYINLGLGIGEGIGEFALEPSWENLTEIAWNATVNPVLETAGSGVETLSRMIPGVSEYYYDEHGAEDIGDAAGIALGDVYAMFSPDEDIKEYASNYYKDGVWEGLWGGFEDVASFVKDSGGAGEAAKNFFQTAYKDGQESLEHVVENAEYLWKGIQSLFGTEVTSDAVPRSTGSGSGGGSGRAF